MSSASQLQSTSTLHGGVARKSRGHVSLFRLFARATIIKNQLIWIISRVLFSCPRSCARPILHPSRSSQAIPPHHPPEQPIRWRVVSKRHPTAFRSRATSFAVDASFFRTAQGQSTRRGFGGIETCSLQPPSLVRSTRHRTTFPFNALSRANNNDASRIVGFFCFFFSLIHVFLLVRCAWKKAGSRRRPQSSGR